MPLADRERRDVYFITQNFIDTGSIFGGSIRLRNAVEAAVLAAGTGIPLMYLPLPFNWRLILVIVISLPLAIFAIVGIEGESIFYPPPVELGVLSCLFGANKPAHFQREC